MGGQNAEKGTQLESSETVEKQAFSACKKKKSGPEILRFIRNLQKRRKRMKKPPFLEVPQDGAEKKRTLAAAGEPVETIEIP